MSSTSSLPAATALETRDGAGYWRGVWGNATVVSGLTALVKGTGAFKTIVIAQYFGAGVQLDAYLLAFLIPSFVSEVLCGAIVPALVPCLVELLHQEKQAEAREIWSRAVWRSVTFVCCVAAAIGVLAGVLGAHAAGPRTTLVATLLLIMLPILPLSAASNVWRAVLNADGRFAAPAITTALTPVSVIISLAIAGPRVNWLAAGTTIGALAECMALGLSLRGINAPLFSRATSGTDLGRAVALREYGALAITNLVLCGSLFLDQSMAAMLGAGAVSTLTYGTRLSAVLIAVGPEALGIALLPRFSKMMLENGRRKAHLLVTRFLALAMCASAAATGILIFLSVWIVKLAFQHGAFAATQTPVVAAVQRMSLLQLPFSVGVAMLTRLIASARMNRVLVPISAASLGLNAVLNLILMRQFSVAGIALATSLAQAAVFFLLLIACSRILRSPEAPC